MKRARAWLADRGVAYAFHDYRKQGVDADRLRRWVGEAGWDALLNRRGTTFRKLPDADKVDIDEAKAIGLMLAHPSAIRRPVVEHDGGLLLGFDAARWAEAFAR